MDPEARAIDESLTAISGLPPSGQMRVIRYLATRVAMDASGQAFGDPEQLPQLELPFGDAAGGGGGGGQPDLSDRLRVIYADREIETVADKILIAAALLQRKNRGEPSSAREIHEPLKKAGVEISNLSAQLNAITERHGMPRLLKKPGKGRQKQYLVTAAGEKHVSEMLREPGRHSEAPTE